jgi:hypothetical protein
MALDWEKVVTNAYHMGLLLASAYLAAHPGDFGWAIPVLQFYGQTAPPPNFTPQLKLLGGA